MKLIRKRIVFCRENRIGHQAGGIDVEITKSIRIKNKLKINSIFIFFEKESEIANKYLRQVFIKKIKNLKFNSLIIHEKNIFYKFQYKIINKLFNNLNKNKRLKLASTDVGKRIKSQIISKSYNHKYICRKLGINPNKYICIYSRDNAYLKNKYKDINWDYHEYRNSNIDNFRKLSEYVVTKYGWSVVRIGSNPEKKISWESRVNPNIIDYSFTDYRTDKNDIDLIAGCSLYFSNGGGPESVAIAARRNIIKINQIPIGDEHLNNFGMWIPKIHKSKETNQYLSLIDICRRNLHKSYFGNEFNNKEIILYENEPEDILRIFIDFLNYKNKSFSKKEKDIIKRYHYVRNIIFNRWGTLSNGNNFIAPSFLMKYEGLLKL